MSPVPPVAVGIVRGCRILRQQEVLPALAALPPRLDHAMARVRWVRQSSSSPMRHVEVELGSSLAPPGVCDLLAGSRDQIAAGAGREIADDARLHVDRPRHGVMLLLVAVGRRLHPRGRAASPATGDTHESALSWARGRVGARPGLPAIGDQRRSDQAPPSPGGWPARDRRQ